MHSEPTTPNVSSRDRWLRWLCITLAVQSVTFFFYPALISGAQFHGAAVPVSLVPVAWGAFTLVRYRTTGERILGYINAALAIGWLCFAWGSNLQFLFR